MSVTKKYLAILVLLFCPIILQVNAEIIAANTYQGAVNRTIKVDMVVLNQTIKTNRLGAEISDGQIYALSRDVTHMQMAKEGESDLAVIDVEDMRPGQVRLKSYKRPRPITLRANIGDTLEIHLTNLLTSSEAKKANNLDTAGVQIMGLDWGKDKHGKPVDNAHRIKPGESTTYYYVASGEGVFMLYSPNGNSIPNSQLDYGLFGAVNVQPQEAEWYRSQVTEDDLQLATYKVSNRFLNNQWASNDANICTKVFDHKATGLPQHITLQRKFTYHQSKFVCPKSSAKTVWEMTVATLAHFETAKVSKVVITADGMINSEADQPIINYSAVYPNHHARAGLPVLNMLAKQKGTNTYQLAHSDLTAIITGPNAGRFPYYINSPSFIENPATPDRRQPYREFTIAYHISPNTTQAFDAFNNGAPLNNMLSDGADGFAVNYGIAGIAPEIYANRIKVGPMGINGDEVDLLFEEFFLSAWAVGDPAMIVDVPANIEGRATMALYPDDPSNVYHSYMRDHVKFRVINAGSVAPHVHHQHAHQWLHTPNSDSGHYLDSQMISPGSAYTLEMTYNGSGNRNQTVGDSIFHCHIYPHFAQGMWSMWRVHDVFEAGTKLHKGKPVVGARALPDGEIVVGTPIPGLVPMPSLAMAPIPAKVALIENGRRVAVEPSGVDSEGNPLFENPGFPFFIPGVSGHRAPHPPLDFGWKEDDKQMPKLLTAKDLVDLPFRKLGERHYLDGGLPRHVVLGGKVESEFHTRWDFTKQLSQMIALEIPEEGTAVEKAAMAAHAIRTHASYLPDGLPGNFILNGLPPAPGAPYAAPEVNDDGSSNFNERRYKAAVIQTDVVFNKQGWHYPQQRFITLLEDVKDTVNGKKAPEPFFFRANTGETIEFWHTNLVPNYYELDDFQVRTPTDILGQHIHLVKFDVTSSDGAGNGFNYEDGTFSPDEVQDRIEHINKAGGLYHFDQKTQFKGDRQSKLKLSKYIEDYGKQLGKPPAGQNWNGAQTTIQRFDTDPLLNNQGEDRTLRTVFTHDHYGPSTHQQTGLYGALLVEPAGSKWFDSVTGEAMPSKRRNDGGPTSWQAIIETNDSKESYREFALAMGDLQLAYLDDSPKKRRSLKDKVLFTATNGEPPAKLYFGNHPEQKISTDKVNNFCSKTEKSSDYASALDKKIVPFDLCGEFFNNGVVLGDNSVVTVIEPGKKWEIVRNKVDKFNLGLLPNNDKTSKNQPDLAQTSSNQIDVKIQTMQASWADTDKAIFPPTSAVVTDAENNDEKYQPFPTVISNPGGGGNIGTWVTNYRSEPLDARIQAANTKGYKTTKGVDTEKAIDPAHAYSSIQRNNQQLNVQPKLYKKPLVPIGKDGVKGTDPYTPMLRAYANDKIEVRAIVGAVDSLHSMSIQGNNWEAEPSYANSGLRDAQGMGISEHFEMLFELPSSGEAAPTDYLYSTSISSMGVAKGTWGIMRSYPQKVKGLAELPNNKAGSVAVKDLYAIPTGADVVTRFFNVEQGANAHGTCVQYRIAGVDSTDCEVSCSVSQGTSTNPQLQYCGSNSGKVCDKPAGCSNVATSPTQMDECLAVKQGACTLSINAKPLVLRVAAGDWIKLNLKNNLTSDQQNTFTTQWGGGQSGLSSSAIIKPYHMSIQAGINPRMLAYNTASDSGLNVGDNKTSTVAPGESKDYVWYAGKLSIDKQGKRKLTPVEFGGVNLVPTDPLLQQSWGLFGALIVEPKGATWAKADDHLLAAKILDAKGHLLFSEIIVSGNISTNYQAKAGSEVRLRVLNPNDGAPGTVNDNTNLITVEGHGWAEEPFVENSTVIANNPISQWMGTQQVTPLESYNLLLPSAGGVDAVPGEYDFYYYPKGPTIKLGTLKVIQ